jgi:hypothetical protein
MGKKSENTRRTFSRKGRPTFGSGYTYIPDLKLAVCRVGMVDFMIPRMSRYEIWVGGIVGSGPGYGRRGSQLSMRT